MSHTYPFMQIDAFTATRLGGNPCAIIFDADDLNDETRLAIAREMNLSETSFVVKSEVADFGARYFTPAEEIPLAGHPTIATVFALIDSGRLKLTSDLTTLSLELRVGPIRVDIESQQGVVKQIVMSQKKPQFLRTYTPEEVLPVFGFTVKDVLPDAPLQTVSTGTPQLMIPVRDLEVLRRSSLNTALYLSLRARGDFFSAHLFCLQGVTEQGATFARHFVTPPDLLEDPFTGSATGGMGAYLWHHGLIDRPTFIAEQGHWLQRPGQAKVEVVGPRADIETVKVGGSAVTVLRGELLL
ncbi:trans-2,3-dihydro-3-hydroxyanthranilate isomerase [Thermoflexales bacterium]|nr:trans-2,3-dihydro-3-hydroxyanthranilate isomerase [Thermoflexales bacterium]